jgi:hypothetical protein
MSFKPTLLTVEPNRELRWRGSLLVRGIFDGEHGFSFQDLGSQQVRLTHSERFTGFLVPLVWGSMGPETQCGFERMNQALKQRAEQG